MHTLAPGAEVTIHWKIQQEGMEGDPSLFREFTGIVTPEVDLDMDPNVVQLTTSEDQSVVIYKPWIYKVDGEPFKFHEIKLQRSNRRARRKARKPRTTTATTSPRPPSGQMSMRQQSIAMGRKIGNSLYNEGWRCREDQFYDNEGQPRDKRIVNETVIRIGLGYAVDSEPYCYKVLDTMADWPKPEYQRDWTRTMREARRVISALS